MRLNLRFVRTILFALVFLTSGFFIPSNYAHAESVSSAITSARNAVLAAYASYTEANYSPQNWNTLTKFKNDALENIDYCYDRGDIDNALIYKDTAIVGMDGVLTIVETFALYKVNKLSELSTAFSTYHEADYTSDKWTILGEFNSAGITAINNATSSTAVDNALSTATNGMAGVLTITLMLPGYKITKLGELGTVFATYLEVNYSAENWATLTGFNSAGITAINNAADLTAVDSAILAATNGMSGVSVSTLLLDNYKNSKKGELGTVFATYSEVNYSAENWVALTGFNSAGITAINNSIDQAGVDLALKTATDGMRNVSIIVSHSGGSYALFVFVPKPTEPIKIQTTDECSAGANFSITTGKACVLSIPIAKGQVLGAEKYNFTILLKIGSKGNEVIELQKFLVSLGYNIGLTDGIFGTKTKAAVISFQIANKLVGDGIVGTKTRILLNK